MTALADIIIVNWNSGNLLRECLQSIEAFGEGVGKVVVVDNGSTDGSDEVALSALDLNIIRTGKNLGFAKACNVGAAECTARYLLFLNPDARLLPDGLPRALAFMESEKAERVGICGVQLVGQDGEIQRHCCHFTTPGTYFAKATGLDRLLPTAFTPHFMTDFDHLTSRPVDQVIGAYFLVRGDLFRELGGFDERFFVYFEEVDFSLRAQKAGWGSYYLADAKAFHLGGGVSERVKAHRLFYVLRSRLLYAFKHYSRAGVWLTFFVTLCLEPFSRAVRALSVCSMDELSNTLAGYRMLWRDMPTILRHRGSHED